MLDTPSLVGSVLSIPSVDVGSVVSFVSIKVDDISASILNDVSSSVSYESPLDIS